MTEIQQVSGSIGGPLAGIFMAALLLAAPAEVAAEKREYTPVVRALPSTLDASGNTPAAFSFFSRWQSYASMDEFAAHPNWELADLIKTERAHARIDDESLGVADAAATDALTMLRHVPLDVSPQVTFSDDGTLGLQWQRSEYGVALIFTGGGAVSVAFRRPGLFYAENGIDFAVSDDLPVEFSEALKKILL
jgi:hypothetical protein